MKNRSVSVGRGVFAAIAAVMASCACGDVVNGVWTGAENAFWTNANNWAGGVVPGRYRADDGAGNTITNGDGACSATFGVWASASFSTINLDGLASISTVVVENASMAITFGTDISQKLPIENNGLFKVATGAATPVIAASMPYAVWVPYTYWSTGGKPKPGIEVQNYSTGTLVLGTMCQQERSPGMTGNSELDLSLRGTGSVRIEGTTVGSNGAGGWHILHRLVNPAKLIIASELTVRDLNIPSGSTLGEALVEITEDGALTPSAPWYGILTASRKARIYGEGTIYSKVGNGHNTGDPTSVVDTPFSTYSELTIETPFSALGSTSYKTHVPGLNFIGTTSTRTGTFEFKNTVSAAGPAWIGYCGLRTPDIGADGDTASFGSGTPIILYGDGKLIYTGPGETTTRTVVITNMTPKITAATATAIYEQAGSGVWTVNAAPVVNAGTNLSATLTLANSTATGAVFAAALADGDGALSMEKTGTGVWRLTAANTYTGTTTVKGGTLDIARGASIASSSGLILSGGTVNFENGDETATFTLPATTLASGTSTINVGANVEVSLAGITQGVSGAKVNFVVPSHPVKITITGMAEGDAPAYITVNGSTTTYSATDGLVVPQDPGVARWKNAVDGDWSDATKWTGGEVPADDANVTFSVYGSDYAARVTSPISLTGALSVSNPRTGSTAMVAISNTVTAVTTNGLAIGDGGKILIGEGGTFHFDNSSLTERSFGKEIISIGAGGELAIDGGRAVFTNFNGVVKVTGTEENPGVVRQDSGALVLSGRELNSGQYTGNQRLTIGTGGRFVQTGGTNDFQTFYNGENVFILAGGEADVSGDSLWRYFPGYYAGTTKEVPVRFTPGTGIMRFRGNAVLDVLLGSNNIFIHPNKDFVGTCVLEFHDHAKFDFTQTEGGEKGKLGSFAMGGIRNGASYLRLYSDARHNAGYGARPDSLGCLGNVVTVGDGYGYSELEITNGTFLAGIVGFRVGSRYNTNTSGNAPFAVTGVVHVAGGHIGSVSFGCMSPGWITCPTLGGDMVGSSAGQNAGWYYGRVVMDGGTYTNKNGHLLVGFGLAEGEWFHNGGKAVVCSDVRYSTNPQTTINGSSVKINEVQYATNNVFTLGCMGGKGSLTQSGGDFRSNLRVFVGGAVSNEFTTYMAYLKYFNQMPSVFTNVNYITRHNATGYLGVLGGNFTAAHSITVGQDGTGVLEVGPTGTLQAASIILTNNAYTAAGDHAATLKFTFGEDGVGTATVTNLVIGAGAALTVDMTGYAYARTKPSRFPLLRAATVEGAFDEANVSLLIDDAKLATKTFLDRRADGIDVKIANGSAIIFR